MRRPPVLATLVAAVAIATMILLGVWQLHRATWKEALLARYAAAPARAPVALAGGETGEALLFRRASATCRPPIRWGLAAGSSADGRPGWRHLATCANDVQVDVGVDSRMTGHPAWNGGPVQGLVASRASGTSLIGAMVARGADRTGLMLIADRPLSGLTASPRPDIAAIPNNHRAYAVQWFLFAATAAVIYGIAVLRRSWPQRP